MPPSTNNLTRSLDEIIDIQQQHNTIQITFMDDGLSARDDMDRIFEMFDQLLSQNHGCEILLSFLHVSNLSSVFIGKLLEFDRKITKDESKLRLIDVREPVYEVFFLTRITKQIPILRATASVDKDSHCYPLQENNSNKTTWVFIALAVLSATAAILLLQR